MAIDNFNWRVPGEVDGMTFQDKTILLHADYHIHDRIPGETCRWRPQQNIPRRFGEFQVCGDRGYNRGLNTAEVE